MSKQRERLKVSASTRPQELAGAIAKFITNDKNWHFEIVAIGAGAVNQSTKAQILARRFVSSTGINLAFIPAFETVDINGEKTAIKWLPVEV